MVAVGFPVHTVNHTKSDTYRTNVFAGSALTKHQYSAAKYGTISSSANIPSTDIAVANFLPVKSRWIGTISLCRSQAKPQTSASEALPEMLPETLAKPSRKQGKGSAKSSQRAWICETECPTPNKWGMLSVLR